MPKGDSAIRMERDRLWIAWETQRRSLSLSRKVGADLFIFDDPQTGVARYVRSAMKTLRLLLKSRRHIVFVQNPSMVLAALACLLKPLLGYWLVVDRHSALLLERPARETLMHKVLSRLSAYTIRKADLTIVTNRELAQRVMRERGRPFVLPDPFPELSTESCELRHVGLTILFVCSWAPDEPIAEVVEACRALQGRVIVFASGKPKKAYASMLETAPPNFVCTDFLPDPEYVRLMASVDAVMALTRRPATLVCGAYEAISLGKPVILGNSEALREYFNRGALYSDCTPRDLIEQMVILERDLGKYTAEIKALHAVRAREWDATLATLNHQLEEMVGCAIAGRDSFLTAKPRCQGRWGSRPGK